VHRDTEVNADDIAVRLDVIYVDAAVQDRQRCAAVLQSKEWATGLLPPQDVVTITRLARACQFELDDGIIRAAMAMLGIDPGPVWDRPLNAGAERRAIRPAARIRFEAMLLHAADRPRSLGCLHVPLSFEDGR
jgi:hypothetical protein